MTTNAAPPPNTARKWVGMNLRHLRTKKELTLEQFAERVTALGFSIDKASLSRIENGRTNVDVEKLLAFAEALDVVPDRLLRNPADLDRAIYFRLRDRWERALLDMKRHETLAVLLFAELKDLAARIPRDSETGYGAEDDLGSVSFDVDQISFRPKLERPPIESERFEAYLEALAAPDAFIEENPRHELDNWINTFFPQNGDSDG
jgi:transcriptional regulator with XRE-family HTH domain